MVASDMFPSWKLGFGVTGGAEAAVQVIRYYLNDLQSSQGILKLDFKNSFNSLRMDKMFEAVQALDPDI